MKTDSLITIDGNILNHIFSFLRIQKFVLGVVNSISQACGKLSFNISNYLHTQKEGMRILKKSYFSSSTKRSRIVL
jgi:hypothetical protein